jgi:hypothetical protein
VILLTVLALAFLFSPSVAGAVSAECRSDPTILLSDGTTLDVSADIGTLLWGVRSVAYTVHIPAEVDVVAILKTPSWPTTMETVQVFADNPEQTYTAITVVTTWDHPVPVTANLVLVSALDINLGATSTDGYDRQHLITTIQP